MRNVILISLVVLLIVCGGGYCITWYAQASATKTAIENAVAQINAKQKYITYESIQTSGFPSDINVAIVKPHFVGRLDTLLKELVASAPTPPAGSPPNPQLEAIRNMPEWSEDAQLNGNLIFGINSLSDHYSMTVSGNWQHNSKIKDQTYNMATQSTGDVVCNLQMERNGGLLGSLWSFKALARDGKDFVHDFRMFDCVNPGYSLVDNTSNEKMMGSGGGRFYITSAPSGAKQLVRVYVKSTDAEVTARGDTLMAAYMQILAPNYPFNTKFSLYGKQNLEMDFTYDGPSDLKADMKTVPMEIHLSKFELNNQVYNSNANFNLSNNLSGPTRNAHLGFKTESTFSENYDLLMQDFTRGAIQQIYQDKDKDPKFAAAKVYIDKYTPEQMYGIIYPALPNFHSLGKVVIAFDGGFQGDSSLTSGDATLTDLELSASQYGITGKGSAKITQGAPMPAANVVLVCTNCLQLIDDSVSYFGRIQKAVSYFNPDQAAAMGIDPKLVEGVKGFLGALAEPAKDVAGKSAFTYTFMSDGASNITISGKRMDEVMRLFNQYIAPVMKHPEAAH